MIRTATQLKAKIRNLSSGDSIKAQILIRNFIMERFLERVSLSRYSDNFILKGGMLVSAVVGLNTRVTMDIDTTVKALELSKQNAIKTLNLESDCISEEVQNYIRNNIEKPAVKKYVEEYLENIAIGLSNIINIFEPEAIAFGGSFSYYSDIFLSMIKEKIKKYRFNKSNKIELLEAKLKNDAGIIGSVII